jgi:hypothetical protein
MPNTPNIALPYIVTAQAQKEVTHNNALNIIDMLLVPRALDRDLATPPGSPAVGAVYIIAASATGAWAGRSGQIAGFYNGWVFEVPASGQRMFVLDENVVVEFDGTSWVAPRTYAAGGTTALPGLSFAADTDTGFTNSTANEIQIVTNGAARGAVFAGGQITLGDTATAENNAAIRISQISVNTPCLQAGAGIASVFVGNSTASFTNGSAYVGFNAARSASNAWTFTGDGTRNGGAVIDGRMDGALRVFARATSSGSTVTDTDSTTAGNERMQVQNTLISMGGPLGTEAMRVVRTTSQVNRVEAVGAVTGSGPIVRANGSDTNVDLLLQPRGTGQIGLTLDASLLVTTVGAAGAANALPANPVGYLRVKLNGTTRKIPYYND